MKIPERILVLAQAKIDHRFWFSAFGKEYQYIADGNWVVLNEQLGPYRIRTVCRVVREVKVEKDGVCRWSNPVREDE